MNSNYAADPSLGGGFDMVMRAASPAAQAAQTRAEAQSGGKVSVAAVLLLSALAVALTILGVVLLATVVLSGWWLVSHIPVPPIAWRLLADARSVL